MALPVGLVQVTAQYECNRRAPPLTLLDTNTRLMTSSPAGALVIALRVRKNRPAGSENKGLGRTSGSRKGSITGGKTRAAVGAGTATLRYRNSEHTTSAS